MTPRSCNRSQLYGSARYIALTVSTQGLDNSVTAQHCNRSQVLFGDARLPRQRPRPRPPRLADRGGSMKKTYLPLAGVLAAALMMTTACSSDDKSGDTTTKPGEKVELTYWSWAPNMDKV